MSNYKSIAYKAEQAALYCKRNPEEIKIVAVSKFKTVEEINEAIADGVYAIGESRAQELCDKWEYLDKKGIEVHFIGRLQTNKVKYIIDKVDLIHSLDSLRLAEEIERQSGKINKITEVLIEINIGDEASKGGITPIELDGFLENLACFKHLKVSGLMAIPPVCTGNSKNIQFFEKMYKLFLDKSAKKSHNIEIRYLSMGMSDDYEQAIACGSNMVRIGSAIFGSR